LNKQGEPNVEVRNFSGIGKVRRECSVLSKPSRVIFGLVLVLVIGAVALALFWPQGFQATRNWVTSHLPGARSQQTQAPAAPPPPEVGVMEVRAADVPLPIAYAGRVAGFRNVEIRARVGGTLLKRGFDEGSRVAQGQLLFQIDPATYKVDLARAEAQLAQAKANATQAEENYTRIQSLASREVSTQQQLEQALAQRDLNRAAVQLAQAEIDAAKLNIQYTTVNAPVTGVTALETPPEGSLVLAQTTILTTITQLDPAYVNFSFTDAEYKSFRELNERRKVPIRPEALTVELHYGDGTVYPAPGRIDVATQQVDPQTGTIQARAIFPNPDGAILPGQFVRVAVRGVSLENAIVVPEKAIAQSPQGASVFVIDGDGKAQSRSVELGQKVEGGLVVPKGLDPGDRLVVDGVIRVRPGSPVRAAPAGSGGQQASDGAAAHGGTASRGGGSSTATGGARQ
jgi:membrane fusion protein, multidrug efflux system